MQTQPIKDIQVVRQVNRGAVLELLRREGPMPRTAIARATRLAAPTSFAIVNELVAADLVRCVATSRSSPGRPRAIFQFNPSAAYSLGVDLSGAFLTAVVIDLAGTVLEEHREPRPDPPEVGRIVRWIVSAFERARRSPMVDPSRLMGIGVAVPALLDLDSGRVIRSTNLNWHHVPLAGMVAEEVGSEVYLENPPRAIALCERWFGAGRGAEHLLCVNVGMGIGMGLIIGGKLHVGDGVHSGELGHTRVAPRGPRCRCGKRGCLEAVAAGGAILRNAVEALGRGRPSAMLEMAGGDPHGVTLEMVFEAAEEGDPLARGIVEAAARRIGIAVANAVTLLNPRMVVLSGSLVHSSPTMFRTVADTVRDGSFVSPSDRGPVPVVRAQLGPLAGAVGAAGIVHQRRMGLYDGVRVVAG